MKYNDKTIKLRLALSCMNGLMYIPKCHQITHYLHQKFLEVNEMIKNCKKTAIYKLSSNSEKQIWL